MAWLKLEEVFWIWGIGVCASKNSIRTHQKQREYIQGKGGGGSEGRLTPRVSLMLSAQSEQQCYMTHKKLLQ